jgi:hypothetical protein
MLFYDFHENMKKTLKMTFKKIASQWTFDRPELSKEPFLSKYQK